MPDFAKDAVVIAEWDEEASVWVAQSEDVPGLATEAATKEELEAKLRVMIPELLELNRHLVRVPMPAYVICWRQEQRVVLA